MQVDYVQNAAAWTRLMVLGQVLPRHSWQLSPLSTLRLAIRCASSPPRTLLSAINNIAKEIIISQKPGEARADHTRGGGLRSDRRPEPCSD